MNDKFLRGLTIRDVLIDENQVTLKFDHGRLELYDDGQCCCETRYMSTDDNVQSLIGQRFVCWEVKPGPLEDHDDHGYVHETQFLEIKTETGFITIVNHNEHNGYYNGFNIAESFHDIHGQEHNDIFKVN